jgi:hypothetical protein
MLVICLYYDVISVVQDALRELNIQGMPAEKETAQMKKVIKELGSYLTQARHALKEHVCTA